MEYLRTRRAHFAPLRSAVCRGPGSLHVVLYQCSDATYRVVTFAAFGSGGFTVATPKAAFEKAAHLCFEQEVARHSPVAVDSEAPLEGLFSELQFIGLETPAFCAELEGDRALRGAALARMFEGLTTAVLSTMEARFGGLPATTGLEVALLSAGLPPRRSKTVAVFLSLAGPANADAERDAVTVLQGDHGPATFVAALPAEIRNRLQTELSGALVEYRRGFKGSQGSGVLPVRLSLADWFRDAYTPYATLLAKALGT